MTSPFIKLRSTFLTLLAGLAFAAPSAFAQTLTITSGQGQLLSINELSPQPLSVQLLGTNGQPIPGAIISFTSFDAYGGQIPSSSVSVTTDSTGTASTYYIGAGFPGSSPGVPAFDTGTVFATYNGTVTATFYETTSNVNSQGGGLVTAIFNQSYLNQTFIGPAGSSSGQPLFVQVTSSTGGGVPNIGISLVLDPSSTGSISCQEGIYVLTNTLGQATCTPVYGKVGSGFFTISAGGAQSSAPIPFTTTVGPPALISILGGNSQSGTPGMTLPLPIVVQVTDLGGNPTPNVAMNFTSVTPGGATFTNVRTPTDSSGKASANVVLGNVPGNIQISVADTAGLIHNPAIFTETVNLTLTGISKNSGDAQTTFVNTTFSQPLTVTVATSQGAISDTPVTFAVTSGTATVATPNTTTNSQGQASTAVTAGNTPGPIQVTATAGQYSVTFNLTAIPQGPQNLSFTNAASGAANGLSPGSLATIYGTGLAVNLQGVTSAFGIGPLPITMAGVTVQFGQAYAPILDVANINGSQFVSVQVPQETQPGATTVTIKIPGGGSSTVPFTILPASPGLFTYTASDNNQYLVAIKSNGTVAGPANPATRGETVTMYMTGVPLTPGIGTNSFPAPGSTASSVYPLTLGVANQGTPFTSVAFSPDLAGVETLSFIVPTSLNPGSVIVSIGLQLPTGSVYSQGATLSVQ